MIPSMVNVQGPFTDKTKKHPIPYWTVCLADDSTDQCGKIYNLYSHEKATQLGAAMARDRNLQLNDESTPLPQGTI